jgi:DNA (cytosine-5)-methyltransferase 1
MGTQLFDPGARLLISERAIQQKLARLRSGKRPRVLDLFSGCGGLSLGFHRAGYEIVGSVEFDENAAASHGANFHPGLAAHAVKRDITETPPAALMKALRLGEASATVDVLVGGPPCQAFARVGRSKLREVAEHPEAFRHDARARLYIEYMRYVDACAPVALVMENVPDMLNHGGHNLAEEIAELLEGKGYVCRYTLLNAAFYGVPQMRERMILVAVHRDAECEIVFPSPTHWMELPTGYIGSRAVALKLISQAQAGASHHYAVPPSGSYDLPPTVTAKDALDDLPPLNAREMLEAGALRRGRRAFDIALPYSQKKMQSAFAKDMRTWPSFPGGAALYDHVIRYLPRDYQLFAGLKPGDQYPEAHRYAMSLFEERLAEQRAAGRPISDCSDAWKELRASIVPPYDVGKFPNKWRKMEADRPSRTLMAHLGKDSYSHIHYDSAQARPISVREAARLQSFPDGFLFKGTMNPAFRQIGNAVPPLLSWRIAEALHKSLRLGRTSEPVKAAGTLG